MSHCVLQKYCTCAVTICDNYTSAYMHHTDFCLSMLGWAVLRYSYYWHLHYTEWLTMVTHVGHVHFASLTRLVHFSTTSASWAYTTITQFKQGVGPNWTKYQSIATCMVMKGWDEWESIAHVAKTP